MIKSISKFLSLTEWHYHVSGCRCLLLGLVEGLDHFNNDSNPNFCQTMRGTLHYLVTEAESPVTGLKARTDGLTDRLASKHMTAYQPKTRNQNFETASEKSRNL